MERNGDPATVSVLVSLVAAPTGGTEIKAVSNESGYDLASGQPPEVGIVDAHGLRM
jgi:hypothetical protein